MGRYLLFAVLAASVGGAVLTLGTQRTLRAAGDRHAEGQADVLAREIAEAGHNLALREMVQGGVFVDPTAALGAEGDYEGGRFLIAYSAARPGEEATLTVTGTYGGAAHTTTRTYERDPMDAPGPLWLDVPFATASAERGARIGGGEPARLDRRQFEEAGLDGLFSLPDLEAAVGDAVGDAGGTLDMPAAADWTGTDGLLEDLNVDDAEGLYQRGVAAVDEAAGDRVFRGDWTVGGRLGAAASVPAASVMRLASTSATPGTMGDATFGSAADGSTIVHFDGDLTVAGRLSGHGLLLINGALRVEERARLAWDGIVVVRSTEMVLPIELDGRVTITGMMVIAHTAVAPGGHLDVSVYRDAAGMTAAAPWGQRTARNAARGKPWYEHTHAFDRRPESAPRGPHVFYREGGAAPRHDAETDFHAFVTALGDTPVYLAIANPHHHGHAVLGLDVAGDGGTGGRLRLPVADGFGPFAGGPGRSQAFPARALRDLDVDVNSLRSLKQGFDDPTCDDWPVCIGEDWDREGALALRVHRASDGARLYESTLYWHLRDDERAAHEAEEEAWRQRIRDGEDFGTHLRMGRHVTLEYAVGEVEQLGPRLGFDVSRVRLLAASSSHVTAAEARAAAAGGPVAVCHKDGTKSPETKWVAPDKVASHLSHGDTEGPCETAAPEAPASGPVAICNKPRRGSDDWWDRIVDASTVADHLGHGCLLGTCDANGL